MWITPMQVNWYNMSMKEEIKNGPVASNPVPVIEDPGEQNICIGCE